MKLFTIAVLMLSLAACGRESSPEGRAEIRHEKMQRKLDSVMLQDRAILDSIRIINQEIKELKSK